MNLFHGRNSVIQNVPKSRCAATAAKISDVFFRQKYFFCPKKIFSVTNIFLHQKFFFCQKKVFSQKHFFAKNFVSNIFFCAKIFFAGAKFFRAAKLFPMWLLDFSRRISESSMWISMFATRISVLLSSMHCGFWNSPWDHADCGILHVDFRINSPCGFQNSPCGFQNSPCGF